MTGPAGVTISPNGAFAYVSNQSANTVSVIETATNAVTTTIPVGTAPFIIAFPKGPQNPIASLAAQIQALIADGTLTQNQGDGLINKLDQITTKLDAGQTGAACNQLSSFINQVQAFINDGTLTLSEGQALIKAANAIKSNLGC
jgi:YVTN family beta-propeller protein